MAWFKDKFRYAFEGLKSGFLEDRSIRLQFILAAMAGVTGLLLRIHQNEWLWILLSVALVLMAEFFNSCIERTVDYISTEKHPQAKRIKDMGAAAVLIASIFAFVCACLIYGSAILRILSC